MPTYQYTCTACEQPLEVVQSFSDAALTECPACGGRLRKVYGAVGVVFKGSGFYKTDSRSEGKASPAAASSSGGDKAASTSGDSGGTSTPAAAPSTPAPAAPAASSSAGSKSD